MTRNRRTKRPAIAWLAALALGSPAAAQMLSMPTPQIDWEQRLGQVVPDDIALTDSTGARVTVGSLESGRPVVLALVYYECPMLCNLVLDGLTSALGEVSFDAGDEFDVWVVSIDPGETPEMAADRRARYLEAGSLPGRAEGWRFLVGTQDEVHALASAVGFSYSYVPETDEYAHAAGVTVLTPDSTVSRVLFGFDYEPRDLKFALIEASEGAIGSPVDKLLLRCFAYDPSHGKYGFAIMTTIRVAGLGTLAFLAVFMLRALLRERAARASAPALRTPHPEPEAPAT